MLFKDTHFEVCSSQVKTANNLATRKINMRSEQRVYIFLKEVNMKLVQSYRLKLKAFYYQAEGPENSCGYCNV